VRLTVGRVPYGFTIQGEAARVRELADIREAIVERVAGCEDAVLLGRIERLLDDADDGERLLELDDATIEEVLRGLLDD